MASWVMNEFSAGPGRALTKALQQGSAVEGQGQQESNGQERQDATMKTAEALSSAATGEHLSREEQERVAPGVHYAFGAMMGAVYGGLAEYMPGARSGFGTSFATALFAGADFIAVPALKLSRPATRQPASALAVPYAAHLVYGASTELVRRMVRHVL